MYLKDEWNENYEKLGYDDSEILPNTYCYDLKMNIQKLYSLEKDQTDLAKKIIQECDFFIKLMEDNINEIDKATTECYQILILAYKLFRIDEGSHALAEHALQLRILDFCEESDRYDEITQMFFKLDDLLPDFDSILYMADYSSEFCMVAIYKKITMCRRYIINYNYEAAYSGYRDLITKITNKSLDKFNGERYLKSYYVSWAKKQFNILLRIAKIVGKLDLVHEEIDEIINTNCSLLDEEDIEEFKLLIECEQNSINRNNVEGSINRFESEYRQKAEFSTAKRECYKIYVNFLVQLSEKFSYDEDFCKKILTKIIDTSLEYLPKNIIRVMISKCA